MAVAEVVELAEQEPAPDEGDDDVEGSPGARGAGETDLLGGPEGREVAGGPDEAASER